MQSEREQIRQWLAGLVDQAGRGVKKRLAEHLGIRAEALSRILSDKGEDREVTAVEMSRAAEFFKVPLPEFRNGRAAPPIIVPLVSWVSAGRMAESVGHPKPEALLTMPDLDPSGDYIALRVQGDSMDRLSPDGSIIVVDRKQKNLLAAKPYVFAIRGEATYKLWRPGPPPRLDPHSWNPVNEPLFPDRNRKMFVVGRVRRTLLDL